MPTQDTRDRLFLFVMGILLGGGLWFALSHILGSPAAFLFYGLMLSPMLYFVFQYIDHTVDNNDIRPKLVQAQEDLSQLKQQVHRFQLQAAGKSELTLRE